MKTLSYTRMSSDFFLSLSEPETFLTVAAIWKPYNPWCNQYTPSKNNTVVNFLRHSCISRLLCVIMVNPFRRSKRVLVRSLFFFAITISAIRWAFVHNNTHARNTSPMRTRRQTCAVSWQPLVQEHFNALNYFFWWDIRMSLGSLSFVEPR